MNTLPTLTKEQYQSLMQFSDNKDDGYKAVERYGYGDSLNIFLNECNATVALIKQAAN